VVIAVLLLLAQGAVKPEDAELLARRDKIAAAIEEIRAAKFPAPVPARSGERKEYGQNALDNAKLLYGDDLAAAAKALKALGLVGGKLRLDLAIPTLAMAGKIQAFYRNGELVFVDRATPDDELVYKLTLALADQRFKAREAAAKLGTSFDAQMAWAAVQHGDADMTKNLYWTGKKGSEKLPDEHLKNAVAAAEKWEREDSKWASAVAPRLFVRASDFMWRRGGIFMETVRRDGGIEAVDKVFAAPPTTEQILHPEKYGKDAPMTIDAAPLDDALAAKKWKRVYATTLGELGTACFLETHLKDGIEKASPGWGGDALRHYEDGNGGSVAAWLTAWDSVDDAVEFQVAAQKISLATSPSDKDLFNFVIRRGNRVLFVFAVHKSLQETLLDAAWTCTVGVGEKREPFGKE
jgi:hypothetical protein